MNALAKRTLERAEAALAVGVKEEPAGSNRGKYVDVYQKWFLLKRNLKWALGFPWCACFATYQIHHAAKDLKLEKIAFPVSASSSEIYAWAKRTRNLIPFPTPGCIGLVKNQGGAAEDWKSHEHTFIVTKADGGYVYGIDGNWLQRVSRSKRPASICHYVRVL